MTPRPNDVTILSGQERLAGRLFTPAASDGPRPAVILVHGLGSDRRTMESAARDLTRLGLAALAFDQRGHGRSTGVYAGDSSEDVLAAAAFLEGLPEVDSARIGVMGHSSGAREAIIACLRSPRLAALVCTSTTPDGTLATTEAFYERVRPKKGGSAVSQYPRDGALPWLEGRLLRTTSRLWGRLRGYCLRISWQPTLAEWARMRPSLALVDMEPRPVLFVHCRGDRSVPAVVSEVMYQRASGPKELLLAPGGWHAAPLTRGSIRRAWTSWLAERLGAVSTGRTPSSHPPTPRGFLSGGTSLRLRSGQAPRPPAKGGSPPLDSSLRITKPSLGAEARHDVAA